MPKGTAGSEGTCFLSRPSRAGQTRFVTATAPAGGRKSNQQRKPTSRDLPSATQAARGEVNHHRAARRHPTESLARQPRQVRARAATIPSQQAPSAAATRVFLGNHRERDNTTRHSNGARRPKTEGHPDTPHRIQPSKIAQTQREAARGEINLLRAATHRPTESLAQRARRRHAEQQRSQANGRHQPRRFAFGQRNPSLQRHASAEDRTPPRKPASNPAEGTCLVETRTARRCESPPRSPHPPTESLASQERREAVRAATIPSQHAPSSATTRARLGKHDSSLQRRPPVEDRTQPRQPAQYPAEKPKPARQRAPQSNDGSSLYTDTDRDTSSLLRRPADGGRTALGHGPPRRAKRRASWAGLAPQPCLPAAQHPSRGHPSL